MSEELWIETAQKLTDEVQLIIEFAKFVPGFINLPQDDQIMLLKGGEYTDLSSDQTCHLMIVSLFSFVSNKVD